MNISILGCGWLGLPLAEYLITGGHHIKGSTTQKSKISILRQKKIEPYLIKLTPQLNGGDSVKPFWKSDVLVLNIPPRTKDEDDIEYHIEQVQSVINELEKNEIKKVIFISATSVYPPLGEVREGDAIQGKASRPSGEALLRAEQMLLQNKAFKTTVLRFGGLMGYDRELIKHFAGKTNQPRANAPVNLIHRDDGVNIIVQIIEQEIYNELFNVVCSHHPTRKEYYQSEAKRLNLVPPAFEPDEEYNYRKVNNEKLVNALSYTFKYETLI